MLEKALVIRVGDRQVDLGLLAETVLFYRTTHLLMNRGSLANLATALQPDDLVAFLERSELRLSYLHTNYGVMAKKPLGAVNFVGFTAHAKKEGVCNFKAEIEEVLNRVLTPCEDARRLTKMVADRATLHRFKGVPEGANIIAKLARQDIVEPGFLRRSAGIILSHLLPPEAVPAEFKFEIIKFGDSFLVDTDLDFARLNAAYHQRVSPKHSSITESYILSHIITARSDSYFAAEYLAEIVTTPVTSELIRLKHFDFLRARQRTETGLELFRDATLPDCPSIREVINSGERSMSEFLKLLDQAQRFRSWLQDANPDEDIIARYVRAATQETWADKLPTKTTRFVVAATLGAAVDAMAGAAAALGLGAADTFLLDKLLKGWRPNHFIEGPFREFIKKS